MIVRIGVPKIPMHRKIDFFVEKFLNMLKGTNNQFHINSKSELALLYNDQSVLENHHISAAFRLMRNPERNILEHLEDNQYRDFRSNVVGKFPKILTPRKIDFSKNTSFRKF